MASATIIKFPDGRTETKNVLTSFEKNGTSVIVFETDKLDNGHKIVGVSYLSDGMYQNVVDSNKWNEVKGYLVDILHDRMTSEDYRLVPEEVLVTVDPYHPLGLRDENLDKIVANYEAFMATKEVSVEPVQEVLEAPVQDIQTETVSLETVEPIANVVDSAPSVTGEAVVADETASIVDAPIVKETVSEVIAPVAETTVEEVAKEAPVLDPFAIADSLDPVSNSVNEVHQDIIPPVGVDIVDTSVTDIPVVPSTDSVSSVESVSVIDVVPVPEENAIVFPEPVIDTVQQKSVVKDAYLSGADTIIQQMRDVTEKYLNEMNALQENYIREMEEMRSEISRNLEEARGINELSKQTFDKAQSLSTNDGPALELTRAA